MADLNDDRFDGLVRKRKLSAQEADLVEVLAALAVDPAAGDAIESATGWRAKWGRRTPGLVELLADGNPAQEVEIMRHLSPIGRLANAGLLAEGRLEPTDSGEDLVVRQVEIAAWAMAHLLGLDVFVGQEGGQS